MNFTSASARGPLSRESMNTYQGEHTSTPHMRLGVSRRAEARTTHGLRTRTHHLIAPGRQQNTAMIDFKFDMGFQSSTIRFAFGITLALASTAVSSKERHGEIYRVAPFVSVGFTQYHYPLGAHTSAPLL
eukprot:1643173-Prymnesium_polylepis.1